MTEDVSSRNALPTVAVSFAAGADCYWWTELARQTGGVPDAWPYGLDRLAWHGFRPLSISLEPLRGLDILALYSSRFSATASVDKVAIAWDEWTAMRMLAKAPGKRNFCGVIWATDPSMRVRDVARKTILKRALRRLDGVWCLSSAQVPVLESWFRAGGSGSVHHLLFGIDGDFFMFKPRIVSATKTVVSIGNDIDRDPLTLLESFAILHQFDPEIEFFIQSRQNITVPSYVTVLPRMAHTAVRDLYHSADVVVVPTRHNLHASGMTVALEAMACGRPVVVTDTPGMDDYVKHGVTGELVGEGDPVGLAASVRRILSEDDYANAMAMNGRSAVESVFNTRRMVADMARILSVQGAE